MIYFPVLVANIYPGKLEIMVIFYFLHSRLSPTSPLMLSLQELSCLLQGNALDLNPDILWQSLDSHTAPGRLNLTSEVLLVDRVDAGKVAHVSKEDSSLNHLGDISTSSFKHGSQVFQAQFLKGRQHHR